MRKENFQSFYDGNTNTLHLPLRKFKKLNSSQTKPSPYPVAVLSGQYTTQYKKYTSLDLKKLPFKTALISPSVEADNSALLAFNANDLSTSSEDELILTCTSK